jgi:hypothetical protein
MAAKQKRLDIIQSSSTEVNGLQKIFVTKPEFESITNYLLTMFKK